MSKFPVRAEDFERYLLDQNLWKRLNRDEEYGSENKDSYGRFIFDERKQIDVERPIVSEQLQSLFKNIQYPDDKDFAIVLSHDIDIIYPSWARSTISSLRSFQALELSNAVDHLTWRIKGKAHSPYLCFKDIVEKESRVDAHSTFFFMVDGPDETGAGYNINEIAENLSFIIDNGDEIGLHGSLECLEKPGQILKEKSKLENAIGGRKVRGFRNHYLKFTIPTSWRILSESGFRYDSTLGFAEHIGFRDGMCHPYHPYDLNKKESINIFEIPLHIMDCSLYSYMGLNVEESWARIKQMIINVSKCKGILCLLWHNDAFSNPKLKPWGDLYWKVLNEGKSRDAWLCGCNDLIEWWDSNEKNNTHH